MLTKNLQLCPFWADYLLMSETTTNMHKKLFTSMDNEQHCISVKDPSLSDQITSKSKIRTFANLSF